MLISISCGTDKIDTGTSDTGTSGNPGTTQTQPLENPVFDIVKDGSAVCRIVRSSTANEEELQAVTTISNKIAALSGVTLEVVAKSGDTYDPEALEIVIGKNVYAESDTALEHVGYGGYVIEIVGKKLVVTSGIPAGMNAAANRLCTLLTKYTKNKDIALPSDTKETSITNSLLGNLPLYHGGTFAYSQEAGTFTNETAYQITISKTNTGDYQNYIAKLQANGFTVIQTNKIGNNTYNTLTNDRSLVTAYHMPGISSTRIIVEKKREIMQPDKAYTVIGKTTLMQLGLDAKNPDLSEAMSAYVIKLADGRFVLMDTGTGPAAKYVYDYLKQNTPSGQKIKIAAVFISHPHPDHMNGLLELAKYSESIECEAVYLNLGAYSVQNTYTLSTLNSRRDSIIAAGKALGAKAYIARTGQKIQIANATFEILWTPEDFGNQLISDYNNACVIVRMTVGDKKVIFLGDSRDKQSPIVVSMYKEALKCDIITIAHHGYTGAPIGLYLYASPKIALWSNTVYPSSADNTQILAQKSIEKHYLAGEGQVVLELD